MSDEVLTGQQLEAVKVPPARSFARLPGETQRAWEAFCTYVGLGPSRSLRATGQKLKKNLTTLAEWSGKYSWVERAEAVDTALEQARHAERMKVAAQEEARRQRRIEKHSRKNYDLGLRVRQRALEMLNYPLVEKTEEEVTVSEDGSITTKKVTYKPARWSARDALAYAEVADRLIRLGLGIEAGRPVSAPGDTHVNLTLNLNQMPAEEKTRRALAHYRMTLLPDRERYIDRLASAEPDRPRHEVEAYVDRMLVEWTAEDFRIPTEDFRRALLGEGDGAPADPLDLAIDVTPGKVKDAQHG